MHSYNVILHYNNGTVKPYMLTNVPGHNENEAIEAAHNTIVELVRRAGRSRQEIIDSIAIQSVSLFA
jgi:hypothetical protein